MVSERSSLPEIPNSLAIAVAQAAQRRTLRKQYESQVRLEVLIQKRALYGATWPNDWGGHLWLARL